MTEEQWQAICDRDASFDGIFYFGVTTTGVVCRPSCRAKRCRRENAVTFDTLEQAVEAGFRPCLLCRPGDPDWRGEKEDLAARAKSYIEHHYSEKFSLDELAAALSVNKSYLVRTFKEKTGHTPLHYHNYVRCEKAGELILQGGMSLAEISRQVGFLSAAHFTRVFREIKGCKPSKYAASLSD